MGPSTNKPRDFFALNHWGKYLDNFTAKKTNSKTLKVIAKVIPQ